MRDERFAAIDASDDCSCTGTAMPNFHPFTWFGVEPPRRVWSLTKRASVTSFWIFRIAASRSAHNRMYFFCANPRCFPRAVATASANRISTIGSMRSKSQSSRTVTLMTRERGLTSFTMFFLGPNLSARAIDVLRSVVGLRL